MLSAILLACAVGTVAPAQDAESRLAQAEIRVRELAARLDVPGIAYAIVVDGQVRVGAHGVVAAGSAQPMASDTTFALGTASQPFTSVLAAILIEDGTVWWEEPIARLVPGFTMVDAGAAVGCTLRDLLCHRTGLTRTDLAWLGNPPSGDIVAAFGRAKPVAPFRSIFQQESTGYVILGLGLAGAAATTERPITASLPAPEAWEALLRARLLQPLGMNATGLERGGVGALGSVPTGDNGWRTIAARPAPNAAPAVGLRSSAADLARWLRFLVGRGRIDDVRLVSIERMEELWRPELALNAAASPNIAGGAALGFDISAWKEHRVVRQDGGSQGLRICTAVLPDDGAGYVLLANAAPSGLARRAEAWLCPALLGSADGEPSAPEPAEALAPLVGRYRSAVLGAELELRDVGGQLEAIVSDGGAYDLLPPDASGVRAVAGAPDVTLAFPRDADGVLRRLLLTQTGMRFECLRTDVPPAPPDPALREYAGLYLDAARGGNVAITVAPGGRLALEPRARSGAQQGGTGAAAAAVLELARGTEPDRWAVAGVPGPAVAFKRGPDGRITGFSMRASDGLNELTRVGDLSPEAAGFMPEIAAFLARHRQAQGFAPGGGADVAATSGAIDFTHQGVAGIFESSATASGLTVSIPLGAYGGVKVDCGPLGGRIDAVFDGPRALSPLEADRWRLALSPLPPTAWLPDSAFTPAGIDGPSDRPGVRFIARTPGGASAVLVIDATTFMARRLEAELDWGAMGAGPVLVTYHGWESSGAPSLPIAVTLDNPVTGRVELRPNSKR